MYKVPYPTHRASSPFSTGFICAPYKSSVCDTVLRARNCSQYGQHYKNTNVSNASLTTCSITKNERILPQSECALCRSDKKSNDKTGTSKTRPTVEARGTQGGQRPSRSPPGIKSTLSVISSVLVHVSCLCKPEVCLKRSPVFPCLRIRRRSPSAA